MDIEQYIILTITLLTLMLTCYIATNIVSKYIGSEMTHIKEDKKCDTCSSSNIIIHDRANLELEDPIKKYDYNKLMDPLELPTNRVDRYMLGPLDGRKFFGERVRGEPDNPRWMGLLISEDNEQTNKIIKLFGRQKYPKSSQYEYYAMINVDYDQIKLSLNNTKELYDGDNVEIPELSKKYKVKLNKNDENNYYPFF